MSDGAVEYSLDMSGFPPGTLVFMTDRSNTEAFMFELWVPCGAKGESFKVVSAGLERNVAADMPERGEAMRDKLKEELEVLAWEAHAAFCI